MGYLDHKEIEVHLVLQLFSGLERDGLGEEEDRAGGGAAAAPAPGGPEKLDVVAGWIWGT